MMTGRSVTHATFKIERVYDCPTSKVFGALSDPDIKRRWFAEGEGWDIERYALDFRVGGREESLFRFQGGDPISYDAIIQNIVPGLRVIQTYSMTIAGKPISTSLATTELAPVGEKTKLLFTEQGAYLDGYDNVAEREQGTRELFEALAKELATA